MSLKVVTYQPEFKEAFKILNLEWIEKYFRIEDKDLAQVAAPEDCLNEGGQIFFVLDEGEPVGTCAMYRTGEKQFELAKMGVRPDQQGLGLGDMLIQSAESWTRGQGAEEIIIFSNTILKPAIALYHKHGFVTTRTGNFHPDYERCDIEMKKDLRKN